MEFYLPEQDSYFEILGIDASHAMPARMSYPRGGMV